ncbi:MAG: hypothetical protein PHF14_07475 [Verrucomicrobiota bacterium]|nr:hypothetical protein [Verrucomicrobiota bacterium]
MEAEFDIDSILETIRTSPISEVFDRYRQWPIPSPILKDLFAEYPEPKVHLFLASYSNTPSRTLEELFERFRDLEPDPQDPNTAVRQEVLVHLAGHARSSRQVLIGCTEIAIPSVRAAVAGNRLITPQIADALAGDPTGDVRCLLAVNPSLPPRLQAKLAQDPEPRVRAALTRNKSLTLDVILFLANDPSIFVRAAVFQAANVDESILRDWADSDEVSTQMLLLRRKKLPTSVLHSLMMSPHEAVRAEAAHRGPVPPDILLAWAAEAKPESRAQLAEMPNLPLLFQVLLTLDPDPRVRTALAQSPYLNQDLAVFIAARGKQPELEALAGAPTTSDEAISELCRTRSSQIAQSLAASGKLTPDQMAVLVENHPDELILYHLARTTDAPIDLPRDQIEALFQHPLPTLRSLAARAPGLRIREAHFLLKDPSPLVRQSLITNPVLTAEFLQFLAHDPDPAIARKAMKQMASKPDAPARAESAPHSNPITQQEGRA